MARDTDPHASDVATRPIGEGLAGEPFPGAVRHFLLICGPFGPFTRRLGEGLRRAGARCSRVILNGGDVHDWGLRHAAAYFGAREGFGAWLESLVDREGVTDVILYGDAHPYCLEGARVARRLSLKVHVMEQGYFRPFWITLERDGVNGNSGLPRDAEIYRRESAALAEPGEVWMPPLTPPAVWKISRYHAAVLLMTPIFPRFRPPYHYAFLRQGISHARRYLHQRLFRRSHQDILRAALGATTPVFLGILQRPGDSQIRLHSPFPSMAAFIHHVVASFAAHAPADARLLFKSHPLDHGIEPHAKAVAAAATLHGVGRRVFFADTGDLNAMIPLARGVVTVNSTAGLSAIQLGLPTKVLGDAIYDLAGLTHQGELGGFWIGPQAPDPEFYRAFRRVVIARTQVAGAYALDQGIDLAVPEVTRRLLAH